MATAGQFPKADGDIWYAAGTNYLYFLNGANAVFNQVDVTTSATLIKAASTDRRGIFLTNRGSDTIYLGDSSSVTTANGYALLPTQSIQLRGREDVYGIVGTTTSRIHFIEVSL